MRRCLILLLFLSTPAQAAYTLISQTGGGLGKTSPQTSLAIDTSAANLLIAVVTTYANTASPTVTDSKANTWVGLTDRTTVNNSRTRIFYVAGPTVGTGHTITITSSGDIFASAWFAAFSGASATPFDVENGSTGAGQTNAGSITPSENNELIISGFGTVNATTPTVSGGTTLFLGATGLNAGLWFGGAGSYLIQTTAAAIDATWLPSDDNSRVIASFKAASTAPAVYTYYRAITAGNATGSDQANFPLLLQFDASNVGTTFKTVANGGKINNTVTQAGGNGVLSPADAIITTNPSCISKLPWETETYDAVNGIWKVWVQVPMLTMAAHTTLFVCYGSPAVTTQQNVGSFAVANVWNSNYKAVWHFPDGSSLLAKDSTSNANDGTLVNTPTPIAGQVDGAASFVRASSQYITGGTGASLNIAGSITLEAWILSSDFSLNANGRIISTLINSGGWKGYELYFGSNVIEFQFGDGTSLQHQGSPTIATSNTIYHVAGTSTPGSTKVYRNGVDTAVSTVSGLVSLAGGTLYISQWPAGGAAYWQGWIDELRISDIARSGDWIATGYANTNAPLTFNAIGSEITPVPAGGAQSVLSGRGALSGLGTLR